MGSDKELMLLDLPGELLVLIIQYLPLRELIACTTVCKRLSLFANDEKWFRGIWFQMKSSNDTSPSGWQCSSLTIHNDKMYVIGGHQSEGDQKIGPITAGFWVFDLKTRTWQTEMNYLYRTEHTCVYYDGNLWILGGLDWRGYNAELWKRPIEFQSSILVAKGEFLPRSTHTAVVYKDKMYMFGGWNGSMRIWFNDLHEFDFASNTWKEITPNGPIPGVRCSHFAAVYKDHMYIFGGYSGKVYYNDLWRYNFATQTWEDLTPKITGNIPPARSRFGGAVYGDSMYIVAGWNRVGYFDDFYCFNFITMKWIRIDSRFNPIPSISQHIVAVYKDYLILFGGLLTETKSPSRDIYYTKLSRMDAAIHSNDNAQL